MSYYLIIVLIIVCYCIIIVCLCFYVCMCTQKCVSACVCVYTFVFCVYMFTVYVDLGGGKKAFRSRGSGVLLCMGGCLSVLEGWV